MGRKLWSDEKLLSRLITNKSDKAYWSNIIELRKRGSSDFFKQCTLLTKSKIEKERIVGIDILSQLNTPTEIRPFSKPVLDIFIELLQSETAPLVLTSILFGIGHNSENLILNKDIRLVTGYKTSEDRRIREGVVFALLGIDNKIAINTLIELSRDRYSNIRNWAIFGLGSQIERDTIEIRDALYERIKDKHQETKDEAIVGLAKRNDSRVRNVIIQELMSNSYGSLLFEAIEELQDITFLLFLESSLTNNKDERDINPKWIESLVQCIDNLKLLKSSTI